MIDFMDLNWLYACLNTVPIFFTEYIKALTILRQIAHIYQNIIIWQYLWECIWSKLKHKIIICIFKARCFNFCHYHLRQYRWMDDHLPSYDQLEMDSGLVGYRGFLEFFRRPWETNLTSWIHLLETQGQVTNPRKCTYHKLHSISGEPIDILPVHLWT